jgi:DNA mismatch endonuclease (patch repair protein)
VERISKEARSKNMSAIRSKGNLTTELAAIALLREHALIGWRRHIDLFGKPDFVWRSKKVALFVDGCFWHGCPKCRQQPINNADYWSAKMIRNKKRDATVNETLRLQGWHVVRIWECEIKKKNINRIIAALDKTGASVG